MKFVLLGSSPSAKPLLTAIAESGSHRLTHAAHVDVATREFLQTTARAQIVDDWGGFPPPGEFDAVIVASESPFVLDEAKQSARAGCPLVVFPAAGQKATFAYELALICDDSGALLVPLFGQLAVPEVDVLKQRIQSGSLGRVRYIQMVRERAGGPGRVHLDEPEIDRTLFQDVVLLEYLSGAFGSVTALQSGVTEQGVSLATVTLAGDDPGGARRPEASWSLGVSQAADSCTVTVIGEDGNGAATRFEDSLSAEPPEMGRRLLARVEAALGGQRLRPDWTDVTRAFEVVDACHDSLRRRRTVDLHFEAASERSVFKSQMTALGCGLLMLTLVAVLLLLVVGALFEIPEKVMRIARLAVFLPLGFFLLMQVLLLAARPSSATQSEESDT